METIKLRTNEDRIIMVANRAGQITVKSHREDARNCSNSQPLRMLAALVPIYGGRNERETKYLQACDPRPTATKNAFRRVTGLKQRAQSATGMRLGQNP